MSVAGLFSPNNLFDPTYDIYCNDLFCNNIFTQSGTSGGDGNVNINGSLNVSGSIVSGGYLLDTGQVASFTGSGTTITLGAQQVINSIIQCKFNSSGTVSLVLPSAHTVLSHLPNAKVGSVFHTNVVNYDLNAKMSFSPSVDGSFLVDSPNVVCSSPVLGGQLSRYCSCVISALDPSGVITIY